MDIEYDGDEEVARKYQEQFYNEQYHDVPAKTYSGRPKATRAAHANQNNDLNIHNEMDYIPPDESGMYVDDELQKAIQESLKSNPIQPAGINPLNETMNDETFKSALELSKKEK